MTTPNQRRVARAVRPGGPEVIELVKEDIPSLGPGEVLLRVEAIGLNHVEALIRRGDYVVRLPFPYLLGGEGAGVVVATGFEVSIPVGLRVCWAVVLGCCADFVIAPASIVSPIPDSLTFENAACIAVAGLTAGGLARVWPLENRAAAVWGAAGAVGRMLVAILADRGVKVIGIASAERTNAVLAAGAAGVVDRTRENVAGSIRSHTNGEGVTAVFDPIGAPTYEASIQMLGPRGCLINYGELSGPIPRLDLHDLFARSLFVTKYNGRQWVAAHEFSGLVSDALRLAEMRPAIISEVAGRFALADVVKAYRALDSVPNGKVLVLPGEGH